jgi:putative oxidoreductase
MKDTIPALGRLLLATIFVLSGITKVLSPGPTIGAIQSVGLPFEGVWLALVICVTLGGGLLLAIGFWTRTAATALAIFTLVAGLLFHNAIGDTNQMIHLLKNLALVGGLLQVLAFGAGAWSIDEHLARADAA